MTAAVAHDIQEFAHHPDVEALRAHDHPHAHLQRWKGVLTAKAWAGTDLACFFVEHDGQGARIVLLFRGGNEYRPRLGGEDMRSASIASLYELDVFVPDQQVPIVDRAERVVAFA